MDPEVESQTSAEDATLVQALVQDRLGPILLALNTASHHGFLPGSGKGVRGRCSQGALATQMPGLVRLRQDLKP